MFTTFLLMQWVNTISHWQFCIADGDCTFLYFHSECHFNPAAFQQAVVGTNTGGCVSGLPVCLIAFM